LFVPIPFPSKSPAVYRYPVLVRGIIALFCTEGLSRRFKKGCIALDALARNPVNAEALLVAHPTLFDRIDAVLASCVRDTSKECCETIKLGTKLSLRFPEDMRERVREIQSVTATLSRVNTDNTVHVNKRVR